MTEITIPDETAMRAFGARLAAACPAQCIVYLIGNLGAGKSTLARGVLKALGFDGPVRSPTYTLVEPYETATRQVYHLDLYRLVDPEELEYLGVRDWLDAPALWLVEWPSHGLGVLPVADITLHIDYDNTGDGTGRCIRAEGDKNLIKTLFP